MTESIKLRIAALSNNHDAKEHKLMLDAALADLTELRTELAAAVVDLTAARTTLNTRMLSPAGLAIGGGAKKTAQAAKPFFALAGGTLVYKPAATGMSALAAVTLAQGKFGMWCWYIDSAGTITTSAMTAAADTAAAAFALMPAVPANKAMIGAMIVTDSDSAFVADTDALDAQNVVVIYIDTVGTVTGLSALTATTPAALTLAA